jgi:hypothetical protein
MSMKIENLEKEIQEIEKEEELDYNYNYNNNYNYKFSHDHLCCYNYKKINSNLI